MKALVEDTGWLFTLRVADLVDLLYDRDTGKFVVDPDAAVHSLAAFLVEDRDTGWLFTDPANAEDGAVLCEVEIDDAVPADQLENEAVALWLSNETSDKFKVVPFEGYDFSKAGDDGWCPIPSPIIVKNQAEKERYLDE